MHKRGGVDMMNTTNYHRGFSVSKQDFVVGIHEYDKKLDMHTIDVNGCKHEVKSDSIGMFTGFYDGMLWSDLSADDKEKIISVFELKSMEDIKSFWKGIQMFTGDIVYNLTTKKFSIIKEVNGCFEMKGSEIIERLNHYEFRIKNIRVVGNTTNNPELIKILNLDETNNSNSINTDSELLLRFR